jgi:hypothetical protein
MLTISEPHYPLNVLADHTGIPADTLFWHVQRGLLPALFYGRYWLVPLSGLRGWLQQRKMSFPPSLVSERQVLPPGKYLIAKEVAELRGRSLNAVIHVIYRRLLPAIRICRQWFVPAAEAQTFPFPGPGRPRKTHARR